MRMTTLFSCRHRVGVRAFILGNGGVSLSLGRRVLRGVRNVWMSKITLFSCRHRIGVRASILGNRGVFMVSFVFAESSSLWS